MSVDGLDSGKGNFNPALAIDAGKIAAIIEKARMFDVKEEVSDPDSGSNATDDDMRDVLEDFSDDPTFQELMEMIRSLNEDEQINLVALAWLGRGTYDAGEWSEALSQARGAQNNRTAEYLAGLPLLGDYLDEGLSALNEKRDTVEVHHLKKLHGRAVSRR